MLWLKRLLPVVIIGAALVLAVAMNALRDTPAKRPRVHPSPSVEVLPVVFAPLQLTVRSQGTVTPRRQIEWASEVAGRVTWVSPAFVEGSAVEAGTPLLELDDTEYRAAVAQAGSALADARLALAEERAESQRGEAYRAQQSVPAGGSLRQPKLQQVEAMVEAAQEQLEKARQDLARTHITAPFDGVIDGKQVDLGQYVGNGAVLFRLLGTDVAEVRLPVTAGDIGYIAHRDVGTENPPQVTLTATIGNQRQQWAGVIARTEQRVDPQTRTFYVVAQVQQPYSRELHAAPLVLGMFVDARIEGRTLEHGMRLPRTAVHDDRYVYVVEDGRLQRRDIPIYRHEHDTVIIAEGLSAGDRVVVNRLDLMVDGMSVTPSVRETAAVAEAAGVDDTGVAN